MAATALDAGLTVAEGQSLTLGGTGAIQLSNSANTRLIGTAGGVAESLTISVALTGAGQRELSFSGSITNRNGNATEDLVKLQYEVTQEGGYIKVISPIDETPAARAGVKAGDLITHLNGNSVQGLTLQEAVEQMRGERGTIGRLAHLRTTAQAPEHRKQPLDIRLSQAARGLVEQ